jgi:hypothetical protein
MCSAPLEVIPTGGPDQLLHKIGNDQVGNVPNRLVPGPIVQLRVSNGEADTESNYSFGGGDNARVFSQPASKCCG